jgi:hypothetical protein
MVWPLKKINSAYYNLDINIYTWEWAKQLCCVAGIGDNSFDQQTIK